MVCWRYCFPETVMRLYTDKESIRTVGVEYLRIVGFGYPLTVFSMAMAALLRCTEQVRIPLYGSLAGVGTNMLLNWVLIFGNLGAPRHGSPRSCGRHGDLADCQHRRRDPGCARRKGIPTCWLSGGISAGRCSSSGCI